MLPAKAHLIAHQTKSHHKRLIPMPWRPTLLFTFICTCILFITGDPLHSRTTCTQPCNVNTHSRAHCSPGARLCEQWGHGGVNNGARLCASARLCRGSPVFMFLCQNHPVNDYRGRRCDRPKACDSVLSLLSLDHRVRGLYYCSDLTLAQAF